MPKTFATWVAVMDQTTTIVCMDAHGQVVEAGQLFVTMSGAMLAPPAHWGCRSVVDIRTLTVTREVTFRDRANQGRRFQRTDRRQGRRALTDRRQQIGKQKYQKQLERARNTKPPPGVEYLSEYKSRGPLRLLEQFADDTGQVTLGAVRPPTTVDLRPARGWRPVMSREEADRWAGETAIKTRQFHSTTTNRANRIKQEGFRRSEDGFFGKGVYSADASKIDTWSSGRFDPATLEVKVNVKNPLVIKDLESTLSLATPSKRFGQSRAFQDVMRSVDDVASQEGWLLRDSTSRYADQDRFFETFIDEAQKRGFDGVVVQYTNQADDVWRMASGGDQVIAFRADQVTVIIDG